MTGFGVVRWIWSRWDRPSVRQERILFILKISLDLPGYQKSVDKSSKWGGHNWVFVIARLNYQGTWPSPENFTSFLSGGQICKPSIPPLEYFITPCGMTGPLRTHKIDGYPRRRQRDPLSNKIFHRTITEWPGWYQLEHFLQLCCLHSSASTTGHSTLLFRRTNEINAWESLSASFLQCFPEFAGHQSSSIHNVMYRRQPVEYGDLVVVQTDHPRKQGGGLENQPKSVKITLKKPVCWAPFWLCSISSMSTGWRLVIT